MARRSRASPKFLLWIISVIITAFSLIYGINVGWLSVHMMYLYAFFIIYFFVVCKGDRIACCYTFAGAVTSIIFLLAVKYLDSILGTVIGIISAYFVSVLTDIIVKSDWRYYSLGDFRLSSFPVERSIQFIYDQHVVVDNAPPTSTPEPETLQKESVMQSQTPKKKSEKTPLSRKEKKAEAKKQKKEKI